jgi:hypothetical protein
MEHQFQNINDFVRIINFKQLDGLSMLTLIREQAGVDIYQQIHNTLYDLAYNYMNMNDNNKRCHWNGPLQLFQGGVNKY